MGKIKIMFVIDNLVFGGGERSFAQLIAGLNPQKYELYVACWPDGGITECCRDKAKVIPCDIKRRFSLKALLDIVMAIKNYGIHIVHSQGARADFHARIAGWIAKAPVIISTIAMPVEGFDVHWMKKLIYVILDRISERLVDHFIVVTDNLKKRLISGHRINPHNITVISNGIELDTYILKSYFETGREFKRKLGFSENTMVFGSVSRLVWQKGLPYLIEAIPDVIAHFPESVCVIVGDGPLKSQLEKQAWSLGISKHVVFTGFMHDVKPALAAMNVVVMPSLREGQPIVALEAMAMSKPVIATSISGFQDLINHKITGFLVKPGDKTMLAQAIVELLGDQSLAKKLGEAARKHMEQYFDVNHMVAKHDVLYKKLISTI